MSEAQGSLPIKRVSNGRCIPYEQEVSLTDTQTQQEPAQAVVTQAEKQEDEVSTTMWENRLKTYYEAVKKAPHELKSKFVIMRANILDAMINRNKQKEDRTENMERG